ncbi:DUF6470 family protein [Robertmurraya massiliosenegalensis]|uniref:DUF6470 family protein n=1 Tax=Robertmurraya massiliosenegalensis TaxID=1287657 RepID=UPI0002F846E6|nr:DUF6470 family protein [Robertmurraya massiliosenegalensis]
MRLPQIQIETTKAQLGLNIEKPQQYIQQPQAELHIEQPDAILNINMSPAKLTIDQSRAWRDLNLIGPLASTQQFAQKGKQELLQGIARRSSEGEKLMRIENRGSVIPSLAKGKGMREYKSYSIKFVPSVNAVKINYHPEQTNIRVETKKPIINNYANKPIHSYQPGKVSGYMIQYPSIEVDVVQ